jgi:hypothetical protein
MPAPEHIDHAAVFDKAWAEEGNTAIELPAVDVNHILDRRYSVQTATHFTGASLWDMEVKKATAPDVYLPTVVRPGSVERFPSAFRGLTEYFTRISDQRLWLDGTRHGRVIEHVQLDHAGRRAFFLGAPEFRTPDGRDLQAGSEQPLFHVEHSVEGTEARPLNIWRIVLITPTFDEALAEHFRSIGADPYLRDFIEIYLRRDLQRDLHRLPA